MKDEINGWVCTDSDVLQYCKKISDRIYCLIQFAQCSDYDAEYGVVFSSWIDLDDYTEEEIKKHLSYFYDVFRIEGEIRNQVIAECIFENEGFANASWSMSAKSREDAEIIIEGVCLKN